MSYLRSAKRFVIARKWYVLAAVVALVAIIAAVWGGGSDAPAAETGPRQVETALVADLMNGGGSLSVVAEITSVSEATIRAESGGRIARVRASLGDRVAAGQVLAEIENSSQRAAVLQAEGAYDSARAASGGNRTTQESARLDGVRTWTNSTVSAAETVRTSIDGYYGDAEGIYGASGFQLESFGAASEFNDARTAIQAIFDRWESEKADASDVEERLAQLTSDLASIGALIDRIAALIPNQKISSSYSESDRTDDISNLATARASITALQEGVDAARTAIANASGSGSASAQGQVKQAEGAYNAALANLEKTIIRSPISGTLNNFTIKLGDFVSAMQEVAVVSNNGALEAVAYVSEEDKSRIAVGQKVAIDGGIEGTITRIAPALDPVTRRIEVRIGLPASAALTNGQSVRIELVKSGTAAAAPVDGPLSIPIAALKMEADRNVVFTVKDDHLVAVPITVGKLSGEYVQVSDGLSLDTEIVTDARGLKEGDEVSVR